jgi:EAL domain-containing protein (putative c-di-GMP-specific phosphodiesterase class I)
MGVHDGQVRGFEALLRWNHPVKGMLMPEEFLPTAENTGQIVPLGEWVLQEACRQMAAWRAQYPKAAEMFISVNVSALQFDARQFTETVLSILRTSELEPSALHLEITETALLSEPAIVHPILQQWREAGIRIMLDDFGTGLSPLGQLSKVPVDYLKIDRSFIGKMKENKESEHIVRAVISLARILQLSVVAEGAETEEQMQTLRELDCGFVQGFLISRPVPASEAERFLQ